MIIKCMQQLRTRSLHLHTGSLGTSAPLCRCLYLMHASPIEQMANLCQRSQGTSVLSGWLHIVLPSHSHTSRPLRLRPVVAHVYSMGAAAELSFSTPVETAFRHAAAAGVFVSAACGNTGPGPFSIVDTWCASWLALHAFSKQDSALPCVVHHVCINHDRYLLLLDAVEGLGAGSFAEVLQQRAVCWCHCGAGVLVQLPGRPAAACGPCWVHRCRLQGPLDYERGSQHILTELHRSPCCCW